MLFRSRQMRQGFLLIVDMASVMIAFMLAILARFGTMHNEMKSALYLTTFAVVELMCIIVFWISVPKQNSITNAGVFQNFLTCFSNGVLLAVFVIFYLFATQMAGLVSRYVIGFFFAFNLRNRKPNFAQKSISKLCLNQNN